MRWSEKCLLPGRSPPVWGDVRLVPLPVLLPRFFSLVSMRICTPGLFGRDLSLQVLSVLEKEKAMADKEDADRALQTKKVLEFNEKLKMDMNRKAESDAELIRLQNEEQARQWEKRYQTWEKEELAR